MWRRFAEMLTNGRPTNLFRWTTVISRELNFLPRNPSKILAMPLRSVSEYARPTTLVLCSPVRRAKFQLAWLIFRFNVYPSKCFTTRQPGRNASLSSAKSGGKSAPSRIKIIPESFILRVDVVKCEVKIHPSGQLKCPRANSPAVDHCRQNRQQRRASDGHKSGNKHAVVAGETDRAREKTSRDRAGDSHRQAHPHSVAVTLETFAGKAPCRESNEYPDHILHLFSCAERLQSQKQKGLVACSLPESPRVSARSGLVRQNRTESGSYSGGHLVKSGVCDHVSVHAEGALDYAGKQSRNPGEFILVVFFRVRAAFPETVGVDFLAALRQQRHLVQETLLLSQQGDNLAFHFADEFRGGVGFQPHGYFANEHGKLLR